MLKIYLDNWKSEIKDVPSTIELQRVQASGEILYGPFYGYESQAEH